MAAADVDDVADDADDADDADVADDADDCLLAGVCYLFARQFCGRYLEYHQA